MPFRVDRGSVGRREGGNGPHIFVRDCHSVVPVPIIGVVESEAEEGLRWRVVLWVKDVVKGKGIKRLLVQSLTTMRYE